MQSTGHLVFKLFGNVVRSKDLWFCNILLQTYIIKTPGLSTSVAAWSMVGGQSRSRCSQIPTAHPVMQKRKQRRENWQLWCSTQLLIDAEPLPLLNQCKVCKGTSYGRILPWFSWSKRDKWHYKHRSAIESEHEDLPFGCHLEMYGLSCVYIRTGLLSSSPSLNGNIRWLRGAGHFHFQWDMSCKCFRGLCPQNANFSHTKNSKFVIHLFFRDPGSFFLGCHKWKRHGKRNSVQIIDT